MDSRWHAPIDQRLCVLSSCHWLNSDKYASQEFHASSTSKDTAWFPCYHLSLRYILSYLWVNLFHCWLTAVDWLWLHLWPGQEHQRLLSQNVIFTQPAGLALRITSINFFPEALQAAKERDPLSKTMEFLWHQISQHATYLWICINQIVARLVWSCPMFEEVSQ